MAAVAAEPGAAAVPTTTITAATDDEGSAEPGRAMPDHPGGGGGEMDGSAAEIPRGEDEGDAEQRRHVRPESAAGKHTEELIQNCPPEPISLDRFSPGVPADPEPRNPQSPAVFLHSLPATEPGNPEPRPGTGLSLQEPAGPTETPVHPEPCNPDPNDPNQGHPDPPEPGLQDLRPGSEVRVALDHVIDDALVVSFRRGEKVFSGVLMDVSRRFGPYGIPITVYPRRDDGRCPQMSLPPLPDVDPSIKQEVVIVSEGVSPPPPQPWTSKPPPLFQEGAPYPPPLFLRDTYHQAVPQPLPRKIKRPKRRYRCEEPTSIMNAIKLRPRQVLCDKCKAVVASGGHLESRRGEEVSRRRRAAEAPLNSELKRLRSDDRSGRSAPDRRPASGIRVTSSSSPRRVLRGVASSSPAAASGRLCLKLGAQKVLDKRRSKARHALNKMPAAAQTIPTPPMPPPRRPKDPPPPVQNQTPGTALGPDGGRAVTRAAALQSRHQKVHFTRRLQNSTAALGSPLPPRMRLKPQSAPTLKSC